MVMEPSLVRPIRRASVAMAMKLGRRRARAELKVR